MWERRGEAWEKKSEKDQALEKLRERDTGFNALVWAVGLAWWFSTFPDTTRLEVFGVFVVIETVHEVVNILRYRAHTARGVK